MTLLIEKVRRQEKFSTVDGQIPTIAPSTDHTDGSWSPLDIYEGEIFINLADKKAYSRNDSEIFKIGAYEPSDLLFNPAEPLDWPTLPLDIEDALNILAENILAPSLQGLSSVLNISNNSGGEDLLIDSGDKLRFGDVQIFQGISDIFLHDGFIFDFRNLDRDIFFYSNGVRNFNFLNQVRAKSLDLSTYGGATSEAVLGINGVIRWGNAANSGQLVRDPSVNGVTWTLQGASGTLAFLSDIEAFFDLIDPADLGFVTDDIPEDEDPVNLWFTQPRVRLTTLGTLPPPPDPLTPISDGDTFVQALVKLQSQLSSLDLPEFIDVNLSRFEFIVVSNEQTKIVPNRDFVSLKVNGVEYPDSNYSLTPIDIDNQTLTWSGPWLLEDGDQITIIYLGDEVI